MSYEFNDLKNQITESVNEHNTLQSRDGFLYNGAVIIAILFASSATFLFDYCPLWAKSLSLLSAVIIAIDSSLNFGARWVYHRQMRHEYLIILARIDLIENSNQHFNEEEKKKYFLLVFDDLFALRKKESMIPGVGEVRAK